MNTRGLMNYIEEIRYGRNMTQEELLEGIISRRQYIRYRNDESYVPLDIVEQLSRRLGISSKKLIFEFESQELKQSEQIKRYYNFVISRQLDKADELEKSLRKAAIINEERDIDFSVAFILKKFYREKLSLPEMLRLISAEISYPDILEKDVITDSEALVMGFIQEYSPNDRDGIIKKLESYLDSPEYHVSGTDYFAKIQLLFYIAKHYGRLKKFENVIKFCNLGIEICIHHESYYTLEYLTYYKALAMYRLGQDPEFEEPLAQCVNTLLMQNDQHRIETFRKYIMKDLNINMYQFLLTYLNERK